MLHAQTLDAHHEAVQTKFALSLRLMPLQCALHSLDAAESRTCAIANAERIRGLANSVLELDEQETQHEPVRQAAERLLTRLHRCHKPALASPSKELLSTNEQPYASS
jgi:hypothetical protein